MAGKISGVALGAIGAGGIFVYAGLTGKSIPAAIQAIVSGKSPATALQRYPITGDTSGVSTAGIVASGNASATGVAIADDALQYKDAIYQWGGAPGSGIGNWDCSSFANAVIGRDLHLAIPGYPTGTYDGSTHGPTTIQWLATTLCTTISNKAADAQAGDLCVWQTHMGIAIGGGQMISAQGPTGTPSTLVSGIGMPGEVLFVRRLKATIAAGGGAGGKR